MPPSPETRMLSRFGMSAIILGSSMLMGASQNEHQAQPTVEALGADFELPGFTLTGQVALQGACPEAVYAGSLSNLAACSVETTTTTTLPAPAPVQEAPARQVPERASRHAERTPVSTASPEQPTPPPQQKQSTLEAHKVQWLQEAGVVAESDYEYVDYIFIKESGEQGWDLDAQNYKGCIGLGQNCPDKYGNLWLEDSCPDWRTNAVCQIKRFHEYAIGRYKSWRAAYEAKIAKGWW